MNAPEEWAQAVGYEWIFTNNEGYMKKKRRQEVFPQDLQKAYEMGVRFATQR
jgi:hypothetical protein